MLPDENLLGRKTVGSSLHQALAQYGWIWLFLPIYQKEITQRKKRGKKKQSNDASLSDFDSCVFHCKSAMKSSTLIWGSGRDISSLAIYMRERRCLRFCQCIFTLNAAFVTYVKLFFTLFNFLNKCLLRSPSSADISRCHSIRFHLQPLFLSTSPPPSPL